MEKRVLFFCIVISLSMFISSQSHALDSRGVLFKHSPLNGRIYVNNQETIQDIIVLPKDGFNEREVTGIINRIDQLPQPLLQEVKQKKIKIFLFNGKLTDHESTFHLSGKTPRGYPNGIVWDDIPGMGGSRSVFVKIGFSEKGKGHNSINLEYHELAHSLYNLVYTDPFIVASFFAAWKAEANSLYPHQPYLENYIEEYFAESFAMYFYTQETNKFVQNYAPQTYHFFNQYCDIRK